MKKQFAIIKMMIILIDNTIKKRKRKSAQKSLKKQQINDRFL